MIDLHIHTIYSDGTDSVAEVLHKADQSNIEIISITDHNSCLAYQELDESHISRYYHTQLIVGCEFTTSFDGRLIEVLGYGFDHREMSSFLESQYGPASVKQRAELLRDRLVDKIHDLGLHLDPGQVRPKQFPNERFERPYYEALARCPENKGLLKEQIWDTFGNFYRKGLANPKSRFYLGYADLYPSLENILELVHRMGGIAFLAHPFQYRFQDTELFLEQLYARNHLDGIECFHTTFSQGQMDYLTGFAEERHLLISGGSDYHGLNKAQHDLGIGCGNLNISRAILSDWTIDYYTWPKQSIQPHLFSTQFTLCEESRYE